MENEREKEDAEKGDIEDDEAFLTASSGGESDADEDDDGEELNERDLAHFRDMMQSEFVTDRDRLVLDRMAHPPAHEDFPDVFATTPNRDTNRDESAAWHRANTPPDQLHDHGQDHRTRSYGRDRDKTSICSVSEKDRDTEKELRGETTNSPSKPAPLLVTTPHQSSSSPPASSLPPRDGCETNSNLALEEREGGAGWNEYSRPHEVGRESPQKTESGEEEGSLVHSEGDEAEGGPEGGADVAALTGEDLPNNEDESFIDEKAMEEREKTMTVEQKEGDRQWAKQCKAKGNEAFKRQEWGAALDEYNAGLRICPLMYADDRSVLYANRAAVRLKFETQEEREKAVLDCAQALQLNPKYLKARLRRAQTYEQLEKWEEALEDYQRALEQDPGHREAHEACRRLPDVIKERNEKMKEEMMSKLKDLGNLVLKPFGLSTNNFQLQQDPNSGGYTINFKQ